MHKETSTLSHDPTQPTVLPKENQKNKEMERLCNDQVMWSKRQHTVKDTSRISKNQLTCSKWQVRLDWYCTNVNKSKAGLSVSFCSHRQRSFHEEGGKVEASSKLIFVLFTEAVSSGKEIPAAFLIHLPHVRLLQEKKKDFFLVFGKNLLKQKKKS